MSGGQQDRRVRGCTGKVRHRDEAAALAHVARLVAGGAAPGSYHSYHCDSRRRGCGGWHVGHQSSHFSNTR